MNTASLKELILWTISRGGAQNFLSAEWVTKFLERAPAEKKLDRALWVLSLSPHYFHLRDDPEYRDMSGAEYRKAFFQTSIDSRRTIYNELFSKMDLGDVVVDYGCGPGFFARELAKHVKRVYACDISKGAIACAKVLNAADNLEYLVADEAGMGEIDDESVDTVISLNMVQHLSKDVYRRVVGNLARKLRPGGDLVLHIQLIDPKWKTEDEWLADRSIKGRIKYRFGIHCFSLAAEHHEEIVREHGFKEITIRPVSDVTDHQFADIGDQHILTARK